MGFPDDPPQDVSGMVNLEMDPSDACFFHRRAPQVDQSSGALPPPNGPRSSRLRD